MDVDLEFETEEKEEVVELPPLNDDDITVLAYTEQLYWQMGVIPSQDIVALGLDFDSGKVAKAWKKDRFKQALVARGLDFEKVNSKVLTPKQITLVNMLLNVGDKSSLRQKLEVISVTQTQYNAWLRDPAFQEYLKLRTEQLFEHSDHEAYKSLVSAVMDGDVPALKLFFEMRGIYNPKLQVEVNVETVIYRVVEIVARHVQNPQIIQAIAHDIEELEIPSVRKAIGI